MNSLAAHAIILRRIDYGEADRIITILTDTYGKIRVMAKGVRKSRSKLAGGIELFSVSEIHFVKGRRDIGTLVSTRMIKHYGHIVQDFERTEVAYAMLKAIDRTLEDETGQDYFEVLHESLVALNEPIVPVIITELSFAMRMLQLLGHMPDFAIGVDGRKLDPGATYEFNFDQMAFTQIDGGLFNKNHIKLMKLLAFNSPQKIVAVQGVQRLVQELAPVVRAIARQYIPN